MVAEILAVGTELLLGQIANTDAQYLSRHLSELGINVYRHSVVGDNPARLRQTLEEALSRSDIVITTGGLGPTMDDLTKETVAEYFGLEMEPDEESMARLKEFFDKIGRTMTDNNVKQAYFPKGCTVLKNDRGTAPGCAIEQNGKTVIVLPGPPRELQWVYDNQVRPYLEGKTGTRIVSKMLHFYGIGESELESKLEELIKQQTNPTVAPYAGSGEVMLRVTANHPDEKKAMAMIDEMEARICEIVGQFMYTDQYSTLAETVVNLLIDRKKTVAAAESLTGGMLTSMLVDIPGVSAALLSSVVTYSNEAKQSYLGVKEETLKAYGAVSEQTAREMAEGLLKVSGADYAVSTTGIAGPDGGSEAKPVGLVYIALARKNGPTVALRRQLTRDRGYIRHGSCLAALDLLRRSVLEDQ